MCPGIACNESVSASLQCLQVVVGSVSIKGHCAEREGLRCDPGVGGIYLSFTLHPVRGQDDCSIHGGTVAEHAEVLSFAVNRIQFIPVGEPLYIHIL